MLHERDNGNVHRAAAKIIVSKSRAARGSVCNVLLSDAFAIGLKHGVFSVLAHSVFEGDILHHERTQIKSIPSEHVVALDI